MRLPGMPMKNLFVCLCLFAPHLVWAHEPAAGTIKDGVYSYEPLGWSFKVPPECTVRSAEDIARAKKIGREFIQNASKMNIPDINKQLVNLECNFSGMKGLFGSDQVVHDKVDNIQDMHEVGFSMGLKALKAQFSEAGFQTRVTRDRVR